MTIVVPDARAIELAASSALDHQRNDPEPDRALTNVGASFGVPSLPATAAQNAGPERRRFDPDSRGYRRVRAGREVLGVHTDRPLRRTTWNRPGWASPPRSVRSVSRGRAARDHRFGALDGGRTAQRGSLAMCGAEAVSST
jgi:hypothetical protein